MNLKGIFDITKKGCQEFVESFDNCNDFIQTFLKEYNYILTYHASNLDKEEISNVKIEGLLLTNEIQLASKAKRKLINKSDPDKLKIRIENEIDAYFTEPKYKLGQGVFMCFAKESLIKESYHYLLFGSEDLQYLASVLKDKFGIIFKERLVNSGLHVLVKVKVPLENVDSIWFENIYNYWNEGGFESSIVVRQNVPSTWILGIEETNRPDDTQKLINY